MINAVRNRVKNEDSSAEGGLALGRRFPGSVVGVLGVDRPVVVADDQLAGRMESGHGLSRLRGSRFRGIGAEPSYAVLVEVPPPALGGDLEPCDLPHEFFLCGEVDGLYLLISGRNGFSKPRL